MCCSIITAVYAFTYSSLSVKFIKLCQWVFSENIANIICQQVIKWQLLLQVRTHPTTTSFDLAITMPALPGVNLIKLFLSITVEGG
jgi:hypothetical protein